MTDNESFERGLRAMLAARDPGAVRPELAAVVRDRIRADRGVHRFDGWGRSAGGLAAVAGIAALIVFAIVVARPVANGPGASPVPAPPAGYTIKPGDGVVTGEHVPVFQGLAALVAAAALLLIAIRTRNKWTGIAATLGCLVVIPLVGSIGRSDALGFGSGTYGVTPGRSGPADAPGMYVAVTGDQPFTVVITVTNESRLPLDLLGLPEPAILQVGTSRGDQLAILPRFVGMAWLPGQDKRPSAAEPFQRVTVAPGESADLAILGMAGSCAIPTVGPDGQGGYTIESVDLVYEQLTIVHTQAFTFPEPVEITTSGHCP